jgi:hypothetical protein
MLQLDADNTEVVRTNVFQGVRWQRIGPQGGRRVGQLRNQAAVEDRVSRGVPADEVTPAKNVQLARPTMRVYGGLLSGRDACVEHSYPLILEEEGMVPRSSVQSIQRIGLNEGIHLRLRVSTWMGHRRSSLASDQASMTSHFGVRRSAQPEMHVVLSDYQFDRKRASPPRVAQLARHGS